MVHLLTLLLLFSTTSLKTFNNQEQELNEDRNNPALSDKEYNAVKPIYKIVQQKCSEKFSVNKPNDRKKEEYLLGLLCYKKGITHTESILLDQAQKEVTDASYTVAHNMRTLHTELIEITDELFPLYDDHAENTDNVTSSIPLFHNNYFTHFWFLTGLLFFYNAWQYKALFDCCKVAFSLALISKYVSETTQNKALQKYGHELREAFIKKRDLRLRDKEMRAQLKELNQQSNGHQQSLQ